MAAILYKIEHCVPIVQQNMRISSITNSVSNILLRELNLKKKNRNDISKSVYHAGSIYLLIKAYPTNHTTLRRSSLVRQYL